MLSAVENLRLRGLYQNLPVPAKAANEASDATTPTARSFQRSMSGLQNGG